MVSSKSYKSKEGVNDDQLIIDALRKKPKTFEGERLSRQIAKIAYVGIDPDYAAKAVLGLGEHPPAAVVYMDGTVDTFPTHDAFAAASTQIDNKIFETGGMAQVFDTKS